MADDLKAYAAGFTLPIETGTRVARLGRDAEGFLATTDEGPVRARHVALATGPLHRRHVPDAGRGLDPSVVQLHSYDYRRPGDVPTPEVTVVGGGNSAAQLAVELAAMRAAAPSASCRPPPRTAPPAILRRSRLRSSVDRAPPS